MIIVVHTDSTDETIQSDLGRSEYSYYFVLKEYLAILNKLGIVVRVDHPEREVDAIFEICRYLGETCLFLSFSPPHLTPAHLQCPTIPVFAWEFYDIPTEVWDNNPRNDWRFVLRESGAAITHSRQSVKAVQKSLGADFPVVAIPSPVWDRFAPHNVAEAVRRVPAKFQLTVHGNPVHHRGGSMKLDGADRETTSFESRVSFDFDLPSRVTRSRTRPSSTTGSTIDFEGIVYTTIFNPDDGRKNWLDILRMFCIALRDEPDATLILKQVHCHIPLFRKRFLKELDKLSPFSCQVVIIDSFLNDNDYQLLAQRSTYVVNASLAEGQCLPLMEYMSSGTPAVAPKHTGMADYLDDTNAFLVNSSLEPAPWPHDPRQKIRTNRHRIDADSLLQAYRESYRVAKEEPARYQEMSRNAVNRLRGFCSQAVVEKKLQAFLAERVRDESSASG